MSWKSGCRSCCGWADCRDPHLLYVFYNEVSDFFFLISVVPPQVVAYKKSEHGNEGDTGVLICKSPSFPPVKTWTWYKNGQAVSAVCDALPPLLLVFFPSE